jgi:arylsulfatase A-like enzyme
MRTRIPSAEKRSSRTKPRRAWAITALAVALTMGFAPVGIAAPAVAQEKMASPAPAEKKPNILFIMGDDIGLMQVGAYHQGWALGETPNIDRIAKEGGKFTDYYAMQSCTSGRNVFFTGMYPLRTGMIPPQLPGSPSYLRPGTPAIAKFLLDLGYTTGEFGKNHLGDHTAAHMLPIGQQLWLDWFETLKEFPPMQAPESYNLTQVMDQIKAGGGHPSD